MQEDKDAKRESRMERKAEKARELAARNLPLPAEA
jgi:hypothetical protein